MGFKGFILDCRWWIILLTAFYEVKGQNITYVGFNVTSTTSDVENGLQTVVLIDVGLLNGWLIGFVVTVSQGSCPFNLQIWNQSSLLDLELLYDKSGISFLETGQHQYDLDYNDHFYTSSDLKLGFTATSSSGSCVAYRQITDLAQRSQTFQYGFGSSSVPKTGSTYSFIPFQITRHYGILAIISDQRPAKQTLLTFGFETSRTTTLDRSKTKHAVILRGVKLIFGHLRSFKLKTIGSTCLVYLQIWGFLNASTNVWTLKYQSPLQIITHNGYTIVPAHHSMVTMSSDRIGFLDVSPIPCVVYEYSVLPVRFTDSSISDFSISSLPREGDISRFLHFQRTHRFAVSVEISTIIPPPQTGPKGPVGDTGNTGSIGHRGDIGDPGDGGPMGPNGTLGEMGPKGPPGPVGDVGSNGRSGNNGDRGVKGEQGIPGASGDLGNRGESGETGSAGLKGKAGSTGDLGISGSTGSKGEKGDQGPTGSKGVEGDASAIVGRKGIKGSVGDKGIKGIQGLKGAVGVRGIQGIKGIAGEMWSPHGQNWCGAGVPCQHGCVNTGTSYKCVCNEGYELVTNTGKCRDIDECATDNGRCQFMCSNTVGSYTCSCRNGYTLANDNHRCNDTDECTDGSHTCRSAQICINTWDGYVCIGPYATSQQASKQNSDKTDDTLLVTHTMFIGLLIWLILVTLMLLLGIGLLIPEFYRCTTEEVPKESAREKEAEFFFYPALFNRAFISERRLNIK